MMTSQRCPINKEDLRKWGFSDKNHHFLHFHTKNKNVTFFAMLRHNFYQKNRVNWIIYLWENYKKTSFFQVLLINGASWWRHNFKILILNKSRMGGPISINLAPLSFYWKAFQKRLKYMGVIFHVITTLRSTEYVGRPKIQT